MIPDAVVQPIAILVDKACPAAHLDAVAAAARASALAWVGAGSPVAGSPGLWGEWLAGRFTKSVRRASAKDFNKLLEDAELGPRAEAVQGRARAVAFGPAAYADLPKRISRLQVSGTELDRDAPAQATAQGPLIVLAAALGMSTGKAAAQAAHALMCWAIADPARAAAWAAEDAPAAAVEAGPEEFAALSGCAATGTLIQDAGLTEIAPGSYTAFALDAR